MNKKCTYLQKLRKRGSEASKKQEPGTLFFDELGSIFIIFLTVSLILAYACYSSLINTKLAINDIAKTYLYQMEQYGYLSDQLQAEMRAELALIGVETEDDCFAATYYKGTNQAKYGEIITLSCDVNFPNPLYAYLSVEEHPDDNGILFLIMGLQPRIHYTVEKASTSKW